MYEYSSEDLLRMDIPPVASARMHRLPPYLFGRINALKMSLRRQGVDIIDLGMGNPNDPTPQRIVDKLAEAANLKRNQRYSTSQGIFNLRRELAKFYQKHWEVALDPETEIIATIGSKEGFSHLCLATLGPGDVALTPTPSFPIHIYSPIIAGANVIGVSMKEGDDSLLHNISAMCRTVSPRPKIVILNFPHNPTAHTVDIGFFEEIVALAKRFGFYVIHDFAYGLTTFDGYQAPSFLQVAGGKEVGVELITMSKGYNMAGWRMGFVLGNPDMVKLLSSIKGYYDYGIFQAIQIATVIALRHCEEDMRAQAKIYEQRRDCLCEGLQRAGWEVEKPKASMFVWAKIPEPYCEMGSIEFAIQCLQKAEVAVAPGRGFGEDGEGYLRIALVENELRLQQAIRQLRRAFPVE
ncbi:aminotransferase class I/II-fold pyridoxal phosphate-dependent enzyme [candidate division KSB3 bacterium]|uniref:Aminotransferase class I/II-fold pyridoxal phosphate-dependent enzyme n=1 Tax=candidate division KSB3 bacterium TaxID=2044937 RepID=A0A9D5JRZ2_9BACT|nr:aminotransferase class I/II-fold pyridoxal phosphate-dependent enzyme [candidate division KSB3 bacterium]MBD3323178.1 aminotransferase class I/II-fold pyridoxal phosphate-dependent enzyme [candidate division KSB3 bacterium]